MERNRAIAEHSEALQKRYGALWSRYITLVALTKFRYIVQNLRVAKMFSFS